MNIAFHSNQLSLRGTEVAMYDYAHYNETILKNKSIIITKHPTTTSLSHPLATKKFQERFSIFYYKNVNEIEHILDENKIDVFYTIKAGTKDGIISKNIKTVVHSVFQFHEPHGEVYAYVSAWLGRKYNKPFVPHIVTLPVHNMNLRKKLNIPNDSMVFGRYGGYNTFDILYVKNLIKKVSKVRPNVYFLFMNTQEFTDDSYKNIVYLKGTHDLNEKVEFINTCDAMIHAREKGETFGLAVGEFSIRNKPVVTCKKGIETAHVDMLGDKGRYYNNEKELEHLLMNWTPDKYKDWNAYKEFSPEKVMQIFKKIFL